MCIVCFFKTEEASWMNSQMTSSNSKPKASSHVGLASRSQMLDKNVLDEGKATVSKKSNLYEQPSEKKQRS